ncbi:MAG TPA: hypothetical protein VN455_07515 [Methanotrichaceae archaeon]|nr:hypothetical protein [Methanotrichaceae archaeon]
MGFKCVALVLVILASLAFQVTAQDSSIPTSDDVKKSFQNEEIFKTSARTGMSPGVGKDVRTPVVVVPIASVAGSWSLTLKDAQDRIMNLTLAQNGDAIFGQGAVLITQGMQPILQPVSVAGTAVGNHLYLFVTPSSGQELYRMEITVISGSMNGNYLYSAPGVEQPGVAFGKLIGPDAAGFVPQGASVVPVPVSKTNTMPLGPKNEVPY